MSKTAINCRAERNGNPGDMKRYKFPYPRCPSGGQLERMLIGNVTENMRGMGLRESDVE